MIDIELFAAMFLIGMITYIVGLIQGKPSPAKVIRDYEAAYKDGYDNGHDLGLSEGRLRGYEECVRDTYKTLGIRKTV